MFSKVNHTAKLLYSRSGNIKEPGSDNSEKPHIWKGVEGLCCSDMSILSITYGFRLLVHSACPAETKGKRKEEENQTSSEEVRAKLFNQLRSSQE